jgi:uncharacterized membrane protein YdjX (TVP38/TMEM64 family)
VNKNQRDTILHVLVLILVIALSILLFFFRNEVKHLERFSYLGIFIISIITNATIIIPIPGIFVAIAMGAVLNNPLGVALAAGAGSAIGELTGYLAGFGGQVIVEKREWYGRVMKWMKKYGDITIFILSLVPNPLFDLAGMAAGTLKMPVWRFLVACFLGKFIKTLILAYFGARVMNEFS